MTARFIIADVFDGLAKLPDDSVDLVLSSPPFLALRSYLPADHPDKSKEIGSEPTPADFLDTLLDVVEACDRVLAPHGSLVFELGDTYSGSGGAGGDYRDGGFHANQPKFRQYSGGRTGYDTAKSDHPAQRNSGGRGWPLDKSLTGIPTLFAWSLAYGRNLLRPERTTAPWRIRNLVAWNRPNPPVGALGDKFRPATSYLTVATKSRTRWFDMDAVRTKAQQPEACGNRDDRRTRVAMAADGKGDPGHHGAHPAGAPPLDWFEMDEDELPSYLVIPTSPYRGSHYATWSPDLVVPFVKSMCPERVCRVCGEPSRRITEPNAAYLNARASGHSRVNADMRPQLNGSTITAKHDTIGWTDCGCRAQLPEHQSHYMQCSCLADSDKCCVASCRCHTPDRGNDHWRPGVVLDPFAGSGTTLMVATGHGRDAVGIDLDSRNADLARERVGMWLEVEQMSDPATITILPAQGKWVPSCSACGIVGRGNTTVLYAQERGNLHLAEAHL